MTDKASAAAAVPDSQGALSVASAEKGSAAAASFEDQVKEARAAIADRSEFDQYDREDAGRAEVWGQQHYGDEYGTNVVLLRRHVDNLPAAERAALYEQGDENGVRTIFSPRRLEGLVRTARGGPIPTSAAELSKEIAELEDFMRTNRTAWFKDVLKQARYRDLLRARG